MRDRTPVRDAATVILLRDQSSVLMGRRSSRASFMPGVFVFPGGAVDRTDAQIAVNGLSATNVALLRENSALPPTTLAAAAIREVWEETGQVLGHPAVWPNPPEAWRSFAATGHRPDASHLTYFYRAVTPTGQSRRFDARFFLADAAALATDPDDFSATDQELSDLQWVSLDAAVQLHIPVVTRIVLNALLMHLEKGGPIETVPHLGTR